MEEEGDGGVGRTGIAEGLAVAPDAEEGLFVFEVVDDDGDGAVEVAGGGGDELVAGSNKCSVDSFAFIGASPRGP